MSVVPVGSNFDSAGVMAKAIRMGSSMALLGKLSIAPYMEVAVGISTVAIVVVHYRQDCTNNHSFGVRAVRQNGGGLAV